CTYQSHQLFAQGIRRNVNRHRRRYMSKNSSLEMGIPYPAESAAPRHRKTVPSWPSRPLSKRHSRTPSGTEPGVLISAACNQTVAGDVGYSWKSKDSRKLAAILAADIAGYNSQRHQAVILPIVRDHGGRVIDTAGDGILAEVGSVVNVVECTIAIQKTVAEREEPHRTPFRIGVNQRAMSSTAKPQSTRWGQCSCAFGAHRRAGGHLYFGESLQ